MSWLKQPVLSQTPWDEVVPQLPQDHVFPQGYGPESTQLHNFILPVIDASTDTKQDQHVYLLEDGLELWHITLLNAPHSSPALLKLFKNMPQLLGNYASCFSALCTPHLHFWISIHHSSHHHPSHPSSVLPTPVQHSPSSSRICPSSWVSIHHDSQHSSPMLFLLFPPPPPPPTHTHTLFKLFMLLDKYESLLSSSISSIVSAPHSSPALLKPFRNMPQLLGKYASCFSTLSTLRLHSCSPPPLPAPPHPPQLFKLSMLLNKYAWITPFLSAPHSSPALLKLFENKLQLAVVSVQDLHSSALPLPLPFAVSLTFSKEISQLLGRYVLCSWALCILSLPPPSPPPPNSSGTSRTCLGCFASMHLSYQCFALLTWYYTPGC